MKAVVKEKVEFLGWFESCSLQGSGTAWAEGLCRAGAPWGALGPRPQAAPQCPANKELEPLQEIIFCCNISKYGYKGVEQDDL